MLEQLLDVLVRRLVHFRVWSRNAELLRWCIRMRRRFAKISSISPSSSCAHASRLAGDLAEAFHRATSDVVQAHVQGKQDLVLALEVVVDRCLREAELIGDLAQRCLVEALLDEEIHRDVEDAIASAHGLLDWCFGYPMAWSDAGPCAASSGSGSCEARLSSYLTTGK